MKRLLACAASDFAGMPPQELKRAICASAGRTVLAETIVACQPLLYEITNAEVAGAFGADLILLNFYDALQPEIAGLPKAEDAPIVQLKKLVGRPVGINLEPVGEGTALEDILPLPKGRTAIAETFKAAQEQGVDFILLTGNPGTGVTNKAILQAISLCKQHFSGLILAGKMHGAGVDEDVLDPAAIKSFIKAGADIILIPAPGSVPGITEERAAAAVSVIHSKGALAMSAIGTSQEGADTHTIREMALSSKRAGVDIQHIGDAGVSGMSEPENIMALSVAIRGKRHTYLRMARSIAR